ncbi:uncharacterized protein LOC110766638 [Prunus avium]|uniref:Uncharacterized protein LOC110766638 n=1 Tax=Prunus avium TaxID=42229 RepID=A0A6P5TF26_PRUAV|nr:uncharacterized protein LOC110766638 [Prunus avium]
MASSKTFLLLGLVFAVVLVSSEVVSARELVPTTAQTQENVEMDNYGDHFHGHENGLWEHGHGHGRWEHGHCHGHWEHCGHGCHGKWGHGAAESEIEN